MGSNIFDRMTSQNNIYKIKGISFLNKFNENKKLVRVMKNLYGREDYIVESCFNEANKKKPILFNIIKNKINNPKAVLLCQYLRLLSFLFYILYKLKNNLRKL